MKALILAGGGGTRMQPLTLRTPKCLLPINNKPNILHLIDLFKKAGIDEIYVSINENQLKINDFLKNEPVNIIIENQDEGKLGSIGGLQYSINKIGSCDLIVMGADNFVKDFDVKSFIKTIKPGSASITLYELPSLHLVKHFGIAAVEDGVITEFQEKPSVSEAKSQLASTLIYGLSKDWVEKKLPEYIENNENLDTIGSMWQYFCDKDKLYAFVHRGLWADIGNPESYIELHNKMEGETQVHESAVVGEGTVVKDNVVIEEGCVIGRNCVLGPNTHLMHDATVGEGSVINGSVVFENVHVGRQSVINKSVIDGFAFINNKVRVNDYCIIGYKSVIDEGSHLIKGSRVWPFLKAKGIIDGNIVPLPSDVDLTKSKYWE